MNINQSINQSINQLINQSRKIIMKREEFERLNTLSKKAINQKVTSSKFEQFNKQLILWNQSTEYQTVDFF
jgi:hypothetical protein